MMPMIMPSSVSAERSLCAQMAASASFRVSMNFTRILRLRLNMVAGTYCKSEPGAVTTGSFPAMLDYTDKSLAFT